MRTPLRFLCLLLAPFALGSCSYVIEIRTVVIDGRLAFDLDPSSEYEPDCIDFIQVSLAERDGPRAVPAKGDDRGLVLNGGVYWWTSFDTRSCVRFPILYGARLEGPGFDPGLERDGWVGAKILRTGTVYQVNLSGGGGYGSTWFRIGADRRLETWPDDPTPQPERDENGFVIDGG